MAQMHQLERVQAAESGDLRAAVRRRVLMRSTMRLRGQHEEWPLTVKDLSSTGMKARSAVIVLPGARVEISLPNIGWVPGEIVRAEGEEAIGIRFGAVIDPEATQVKVSGSYSVSSSPGAQLRRV